MIIRLLNAKKNADGKTSLSDPQAVLRFETAHKILQIAALNQYTNKRLGIVGYDDHALTFLLRCAVLEILSGVTPRSARTLAIPRASTPQLGATLDSHRLCTFILHTTCKQKHVEMVQVKPMKLLGLDVILDIIAATIYLISNVIC